MTGSRLLETAGYNQLARTREGYVLYNTNDIYIGQAIAKYGEFSRLEMELFEQIIGQNDIIIEVGANIGAHTIGLAQRVGPYGRVLAFEPQRIVFQTLCANIALNSLTNVDCYWAAAGVEPGFIEVPELDPQQRSNFGGVSLKSWVGGQRVECIPLDRFFDLPRLSFIKVDVEGMEAEVLAGGRKLIDKFRPVLYVENDRLEKSEALMRQVADMGYRMYWHMPRLFNPNNFYGIADDIYPGIVSLNMLCVHRDSPKKVDAPEATDFTFHPMGRA